MELNEIKKALYKQNPNATLQSVRADGITYSSPISIGEGITFVYFRVPLNELGETIWQPNIDGKLLIRYLINY